MNVVRTLFNLVVTADIKFYTLSNIRGAKEYGNMLLLD